MDDHDEHYWYTHLIKSCKIAQEPEIWCGTVEWGCASFDAPDESACPQCLVEKGLSEWGIE